MMRGSITEGQTQVVFARVDPLLQTLLPLVTKYQQLVPVPNNDQALTLSLTLTHDDQALIQIIQALIKNIDRLQQTILQFGNPFAPSLIVLADYISLPLNAILHIQDFGNISMVSLTSKADEGTRRNQIRISHIRALHRSTAATMQVYVETCCGIGSRSNNIFSVSMKHNHLIKFLVALTNVLPVLSSSSTNSNDNALDDGTETWLVILTAIEGIISASSGDEVVQTRNENLAARIADCASSLSLSNIHELSLQSLKTLHCILKATFSNTSLWQSIFPGVFAALYRRLQTMSRQTPSKLSISIEAKSLEILNSLLKITLAETPEMTAQRRRSAIDILQELAITSNSNDKVTMNSNSSDQNDSDLSQSTSFLSQVKERVPAPLSSLLRQGMISSSSKVKLQILSLCNLILLGITAETWKSTELKELSLDICLILQSDNSEEEEVASRARSLLQQVTKEEDYLWMIPRFHALLEETSVLAQGSKMIELQTQLQLLIGYIQAVGSNGSSALAASTSIIRFLVVLSDIDFGSAISTGPTIEVEDNKQEDGSLLHFRHYRGSIGSLVRKLLRMLGKTLGTKHGSVVVDACISDFYEAITMQQSSRDSFHPEFLHKWIGIIVVSREILNGAFSLPSKSSEEISSKERRRRRRLLKSLSSSILPLLVESFLWNLPTTQRSKESTKIAVSDRNGSNKFFSPVSLHGNICVIVLLLELQSSFFELLGQDVSNSLVSSMLYPIVEKASQANGSLVQRAARRTLIVLAKVHNFSNLQDFLCQEFTPILAAIFGRLRLPGGMLVPANGDLDDTLLALASTTWILQHAKKRDESKEIIPYAKEVEAERMSLVDLISLLEDRFDHLSLRNVISESDAFGFVTMHQVCFDYLNHSFGVEYPTIYSYPTERFRLKNPKPWLDLLSAFKRTSLIDFQQTSSEQQYEDAKIEENESSLIVGTEVIEFVSRLISKDCYKLSNQDLRIQVEACTSLISGYRFLAFISCNYEDKADEQSTIKNSILRQAASSWPSIKARLCNVFEEVVGSKIVDLTMMVRVTSGPLPLQDIGAKRFFLAKIFTLIATICECGGEFMIDRFKNDIWPVTARFLGRVLEKETRKEANNGLRFSMIQSLDDIQPKHPCTLNDSELHLILSIFDCLCRVLHILVLPESLLSSVGSTLLPFLDDGYYPNDIAASAMLALKKILERNYDILYRPILELSGSGIPPCPLLLLSRSVDDNLLVPRHHESSVLGAKANELLAHIDSLPEQDID